MRVVFVALVALSACGRAPATTPARRPAVIPPTHSIAGQVRVADSGEPLAGVTVVATRGSGHRAAVTDERGWYEIAGLGGGEYSVTFYYGKTTVKRTGIRLRDGRTQPVFVKIEEGDSEDVIRIYGTPNVCPLRGCIGDFPPASGCSHTFGSAVAPR